MSVSLAGTGTPTTGIHQSFWSRAATWLLKIGGAIKGGLQAAVAEAPKLQQDLNKIAPTVEAVSDMIVPGSGTFEQHILDVYGYVAKLVAEGGAAVSSVTISTPTGSIALDTQLVSDIKNFVPSIQSFMHPAATVGPTPAPAVATKS